MYLKSLKVTDYSTGSSYTYSDKSGSWKSIVAEGGQVEGNDGAEPQSTQSAPPVTSTVENIPIPWSGTHRETSSFVTPSIWPWGPYPDHLYWLVHDVAAQWLDFLGIRISSAAQRVFCE